jgi:arylsulfatase A-like enzyme
VRLITWLTAILLLTTCSREPGFEETARHVILISMDTARADHFGFLGSHRAATPRLDELADESIVFTDCMTVVPTTLASHTSLFTGKYPHHHGVARNGFTVNQANQMLPEILKRAGFFTAGFAGSFALDSAFGFDQGFDHYDQDFDRLRSAGKRKQLGAERADGNRSDGRRAPPSGRGGDSRPPVLVRSLLRSPSSLRGTGLLQAGVRPPR